jgi:DNA replication protein DnaC
MKTENLVDTLKSLKLYGMAQTVTELNQQSSPAYLQSIPLLEILIAAEIAERDIRSINYQMKTAKFPIYRDLAGFDFAQSDVDEPLIKALHQCEFMEDAQNVVLVGGPGTGKTHLATAIGVQAIQQHRFRVRFLSTVELVTH